MINMHSLAPTLFTRLDTEQHVGTDIAPIYGDGGMAPAQLDAIEHALGFQLPPDFRFLLENLRDPGEVFFPWSRFDKAEYDPSIEWVFDGIAGSIERNNLWLRRWGERPHTLADAIRIARADFAHWPKLLPLYGHRYLAAEPPLAGNPVFSIMGTDIIHCGSDLAHYLLEEFVPGEDWSANTQNPRHIPIWSAFAEEDLSLLAWPSGMGGNAPWKK
jgi:hypothetical protein